MQYSILLALPLLAAAAPFAKRQGGGAGAPTRAALPAGCPIQHSYPSPNSTAFAPTAAYAAKVLYQYSLSPGETSPDGTDDAAATQQCLETCYGYGNPGDCTAVWTGHNATASEYGTTSRAEFVCMLFAGGMGSDSLGAPDSGDADASAHALTIGCAARSG